MNSADRLIRTTTSDPGIRLLHRATTLGIPAFVLDKSGRVQSRTPADGAIARWLAQPEVAEQFAELASGLGIHELCDGLAAIIIAPRTSHVFIHRVVALLPMHNWEASYLPDRFRGSERVFAEAVPHLHALTTRSETTVEDIHACLDWALDDLLTNQAGAIDLLRMTQSLRSSYEQLTLLHSLNAPTDDLRRPSRVVARVCQRVTQRGGFSWVVARFSSKPDLTPILSGEMLLAGDHGMQRGEIRLTCDLVAAEFETRARYGEPVQPGPVQSRVGPVIASPLWCENEIAGVIIAQQELDEDDPVYTSERIRILEAAANTISSVLGNATLYDRQNAMFLGMLEALTATIDAKDPYTRGHSQRVAQLSYDLALAAGIDVDTAERIRISGLVHDIGKIGVPEAVLCKPGKLSDTEFELVKAHPEIGHRILHDIPGFRDVLPGVLSHHERWDGRGYPHGLVGDDIPLFGRIIGLADAFDAMSSSRTYRQAMNRSRALTEIDKNAGTQFDPWLVPYFFTLDLANYDHMLAEHTQAATGMSEPPPEEGPVGRLAA